MKKEADPIGDSFKEEKLFSSGYFYGLGVLCFYLLPMEFISAAKKRPFRTEKTERICGMQSAALERSYADRTG